jgi:aryl-alcohol dehydrogenase-like predicted oxidoreductase
MRYRMLGRTGWSVSEIGYGMWGLAGWTGSDDSETINSLERAIELGCNFFDTAWAYGNGRSERLLGQLVRSNPGGGLIVATKVPPKNLRWPSQRGFRLEDCFPSEHIREYTEKSLENLGVSGIDLLQFHVWEDAWSSDERWARTVLELKRQGLVRTVGLSVNRWEPENCLNTLRTGLIDTVQVIYNIFDQAPQDALFPLCRELKIGVIARVPFDEGTLTGSLTKQTRWPEGDWRNSYFVPENLIASVDRAEALRPLIPAGMSMPELALRWILADPTVSTIIPGMRKRRHVEANMAASDGERLDARLLDKLKAHRCDREPTEWSQEWPCPLIRRRDSELASDVQSAISAGSVEIAHEMSVLSLDLLVEGLDYVAHRDEAHDLAIDDHGKLADLVPAHLSHDFMDIIIEVAGNRVARHDLVEHAAAEAVAVAINAAEHVALGKDADQAVFVVDDGQRTDIVMYQAFDRCGDCRVGADRDRLAALALENFAHLHDRPPSPQNQAIRGPQGESAGNASET